MNSTDDASSRVYEVCLEADASSALPILGASRATRWGAQW
jgi:hypothetical protein